MSDNRGKEYLFDAAIIDELDWNDSPVHPADISRQFLLRPLAADDYDKGFPHVLDYLTRVGKVSAEEFLDTFNKMKNCPDTYYVTVLEDLTSEKIVGSVTLFVEQKFIHNCAKRGRIEDLVVAFGYQGQQLGKLLVETAKRIGVYTGCYKLSLDCKDELKPYYRKCGFKTEESNCNFMVIRLQD